MAVDIVAVDRMLPVHRHVLAVAEFGHTDYAEKVEHALEEHRSQKVVVDHNVLQAAVDCIRLEEEEVRHKHLAGRMAVAGAAVVAVGMAAAVHTPHCYYTAEAEGVARTLAVHRMAVGDIAAAAAEVVHHSKAVADHIPVDCKPLLISATQN